MQLIIVLFFQFNASHAEKLNSFITPVINVEANLGKSDQGFVTNSPSYLKKTSSQNSIGNGESLRSFLFDEPNLDVTGGPRTSAQLPQIRGLGSERTLILDEGVRQNFQSGHNGRVFTDFNLVREVEIIKGPWSSLYGSGALGGVINFRRVQATDYKPKNLGTEINTSLATANNSFTQTLIVYSNKSKIKPLLSVRNVKTKDIRLGSGKDLSFSSTDLREYSLSLEYDLNKKNSLTLKSVFHENKTKTPLNPNVDTEDLDSLGQNSFNKNDAVLTYEYKSKNLSLTAKPYIRQSLVKTQKLTESRNDKRRVTTYGVDAWVNLNHNLKDESLLSSIVGFEYFFDDNDGVRNGESLESFPNGTSEYLSAYLQESLYLNKKLELSAGLRFDSFSNKDVNNLLTTNKGNELTARAQVSYKLNDRNSFFLGYGQAFNAPRIQDIFITGLHFPGAPPFIADNFFIPNPNIKPETSDSYEIGYKITTFQGRLGLTTTFFHNEVDNFIARDVNIAAGVTQFINQSFVKLSGFEFKTSYEFTKKIKATLNYGQTRSRIVNEGTPVYETLPDKWALILSYKPTDKLSLESISQLYERQNRVPLGFDETPGYFLQNFYLNYKAHKKLNFRLSLLNALDREHVQHGNFIEGPGRSLELLAKYIY